MRNQWHIPSPVVTLAMVLRVCAPALLLAGLLALPQPEMLAQAATGAAQAVESQKSADAAGKRTDEANGQRRRQRQEMLQFRILDRLSRMAPADRERLLSRMPEGRRRRVETNLKRLEAMSPEQREKLAQQLRSFRAMSPERRQRLRDLTRELGALPQERRGVVRNEFVKLQRMPEDERIPYVESDTFEKGFSLAERELILNLVEIAPEPPHGAPFGPGSRGRGNGGPPGSQPAIP